MSGRGFPRPLFYDILRLVENSRKIVEKVQVNNLKRKMDQLRSEKFEYEMPKLIFSEERLEIKAVAGKRVKGSFVIENTADRKIRGLIYSSSARMACDPPDFYARSVFVTYEADTTGMRDGEALEGFFTVCSEIGEWELPYRVEILESQDKERAEYTKSLEAFAKMARQDFQKAYLFFIKSDFPRMLEQDAPEYLTLYEGVREISVSYRSMEEFLVACKKKDPIFLRIRESHGTFEELEDSIKESILIVKNQWGFQRLDFIVDADFIRLERNMVTTDEFIGNSYQLDFIIEQEKLHAGRNYGSIRIQTSNQELRYEMVVTKKGTKDRERKVLKTQREIEHLVSLYISLQTRQISVEEWQIQSLEALKEYQEFGGNHPILELFQAQIYFTLGKFLEAHNVLEAVENRKRSLDNPEVRGYYLYLTTFYQNERKYVDAIEDEIVGLAMQNRESWKLQWILLHLQEKYLNYPQQKIDAVREKYVSGCRSRILFLEVYQLFEREPVLIKRLDEFTISVLKFACKENLLTKEVVQQIADLALRCKEYDEMTFAVLKECYEQFPSQQLVRSICELLLKGQKTDQEAFIWYAKGVEEDLRVAGLYEAYVESMSENSAKKLPQIIRMYFAYNNTLNYQKKAFVYASVVQNREEDPQSYRSYRPSIEKFMLDQLAFGRINQNLAMLYKRFLTKNLLNKRLAEGLGRSLFTYELTCHIPEFTSAIVIHRQLREESIVPIVQGKAQIQLYTEDYSIVFVDSEGNRYASSSLYELDKLLSSDQFMEWVKELAPDYPGMLLWECEQVRKTGVLPESITEVQRLVEVPEIREEYRMALRKEILDFYTAHPFDQGISEYLKSMNYEIFLRADKKELLELLIDHSFYREAFDLICTYGYEEIELGKMTKLCSNMVVLCEYSENKMLLPFCEYCFQNKKYDKHILTYLIFYYDGPIKAMKKVWKASRDFDLDGFQIEEKILEMIVFTRSGVEGSEEIYESYSKGMGDRKLCHAYLVLRSYDYFVKEKEVGQIIFDKLEKQQQLGLETEEVCELALLRHYAELSRQTILSEQQEILVSILLEKYAHRGMRFRFFQEFPDAYTRPYQLQDKVFIEYRTNPRASVTLYYYVDDNKKKEQVCRREPMLDMYEGIFSKEFTLFYGEKLTYYIVEECDGEIKKSKVSVMEYKKEERDQNSKYELLNRMAKYLEKGEQEQLAQTMDLYIRQQTFVDEVLKMI